MYLLKKKFGKNKLVMEIGSYMGGTTKHLAKNNRVIAVDPFISGYDKRQDDICSKLNGSPVFRKFKENTKGKQVVLMKEKSEDLIKRWKLELDCLFIDGEHTTEAVKRDSKWIKYVKKGGLFAYHDVAEQFPDIFKFIKKEIVPNYRFVAKRGSLWIFQK